MRLVTHNILKCNIAGVENGYPLRIEVEHMEIEESEMNPEIVKSMTRKMNWQVLRDTCMILGFHELDDYENFTPELFDNPEFLARLHHILFEVHIQEGNLVCPITGRKFPIHNGIPNMMLMENELP